MTDHDHDPDAAPPQDSGETLHAGTSETKLATTTVDSRDRHDLDDELVVLVRATVRQVAYKDDNGRVVRVETVRGEQAWVLRPAEGQALVDLVKRRHDPDAANLMLFDGTNGDRVLEALGDMATEAAELFTSAVPDDLTDLLPGTAQAADLPDPDMLQCPDCTHLGRSHGAEACEADGCPCIMSAQDVAYAHAYPADSTERVAEPGEALPPVPDDAYPPDATPLDDGAYMACTGCTHAYATHTGTDGCGGVGCPCALTRGDLRALDDTDG